MKPLRLCWDCKAFYFDEGSPHYSEYTPGGPAELRCASGHWSMDNDFTDSASVKKCFQRAKTCKDYDPRKTPIEELAMETEDI